MTKKRAAASLIGAVGILLIGAAASAHQTDASLQMTEIRPETGEVEQLLSVSAEDLAHQLGFVDHGEFPSPGILATNRQVFEDYLNEHTMVRADQEECELRESSFVAFPGQDGRVHFHQLWQCPRGAARVILGNQVMFASHGGYRHTGRIQVGVDILATVFDRNYPTYTVDLDPSANVEEGLSGDEGDSEGTPPKERRIWLGMLAAALVVGTLFYWFRNR